MESECFIPRVSAEVRAAVSHPSKNQSAAELQKHKIMDFRNLEQGTGIVLFSLTHAYTHIHWAV